MTRYLGVIFFFLSVSGYCQSTVDVVKYFSALDLRNSTNYHWDKLELKVEVIYDSLGCTFPSIYLSDPYLTKRDVHIMFDKEGDLASVLCLFHNGNSIRIWYDGGKMKRKVESTSAGESVEYVYYDNGKINLERHFDSSGIGFEKEYSISGEFVDIRFI